MVKCQYKRRRGTCPVKGRTTEILPQRAERVKVTSGRIRLGVVLLKQVGKTVGYVITKRGHSCDIINIRMTNLGGTA